MSSNYDSEQGLETRVEKTWTTLDYRDEKWGFERIAYDGIQNHFPGDCGGDAYGIFFFQDGWIDFHKYDPSKKVSGICFFDNGSGYDPIYTVLRHSSKVDRETQTGKFGEGIKMISAASLNHDVEIIFFSQDWSASPLTESVYLPKEKKSVDVLCQKITTGLNPIKGSRTLYRNPPKELVEQVLTFKERIIDFRRDLLPGEIPRLHSKHRVFKPVGSSGELFIRRIKYPTSKPLYLTYQINGRAADPMLSPDRDHVIESSLNLAIKYIIVNLNDVKLMKPLIDNSTPNFFEKEIIFNSNDSLRSPRKWRQAFYELYGAKAVLAERDKKKSNVNGDVIANGFKVVESLPYGIHTLLKKAGIKVAGDCLNYRPRYDEVKLSELSRAQMAVYELHRFVAPIIIRQETKARLHIFSRAYDEHGDSAWFEGMSYWGCDSDGADIYVRLSRFDSLEDFLAVYSHELIHTHTRSADVTEKFEKGLTKALGNALAYILANRKQ